MISAGCLWFWVVLAVVLVVEVGDGAGGDSGGL